MRNEYIYIAIMFVLILAIAVLLFIVSNFLISKSADMEKLSAYECGFDPFSDSRELFDVRFYLVAILFIVFDIEVMFLFPWAVTLRILPDFSFWLVQLFLIILIIGFFYEWRSEALDWE
jgi:NADH:ubiquinone oxidoreductase subunit 3 (subunit A)